MPFHFDNARINQKVCELDHTTFICYCPLTGTSAPPRAAHRAWDVANDGRSTCVGLAGSLGAIAQQRRRIMAARAATTCTGTPASSSIVSWLPRRSWSRSFLNPSFRALRTNSLVVFRGCRGAKRVGGLGNIRAASDNLIFDKR